MSNNTTFFGKLTGLYGAVRRNWLSHRIYDCADKNDTRGIRKCLRAGVDPNHPLADHGLTPMHIAAANGYHVMLSLLLAYGADVDQKAENGNTMLGVALDNGHEEAAALLLAHGADPNKAHLTNYEMIPVLNRLIRLHSKQQTGTDDYARLSDAVETLFSHCRSLPRKRNFNGTEWGRAKAA